MRIVRTPKRIARETQKEAAIVLLLEDLLTDNEIAKRLKITRQTLATWKREPWFITRTQALADEIAKRTLEKGVADRTRRVAALSDRWRKLQRTIVARAADPSMQAVPGGPEGLMVRTVKMIGGGESAMMVEEYEVDTGLLRELREHEKQAAQELGQWTEKREVSGNPDKPITVITLKNVSTEDI